MQLQDVINQTIKETVGGKKNQDRKQQKKRIEKS